jgi:Competence protein A.
MNLLNIISNKKAIGGLEIADDGFRFSRIKKVDSDLTVELLFEEKISESDALAGETAITNKLIKFIKQHDLEYVIVSVPANHVYIKTYDFNPNLSSDKVNEAMHLNSDLQLPKKKEDIYCDWMTIGDSETEGKTILLAYILKSYVRSLISKIKNTNLKIIAIESHQLSLARSLKQDKDEVTLVIERGAALVSFYLIKNHNVIFSQSRPNELIGKNLHKEVDNVINYQDFQGVTVSSLVLIGPFSEAEIKKLPIKPNSLKLIDELKSVKDSKWAITLGAALRGAIPRKDDKIISLMSIDTEQAYHQEKANGTTTLIVSISITLSVFFAGVFLAAWYFMLALQNNYNQRISAWSNTSSESTTSISDKANTFNNLIGQTSALIKKEVAWSKIITEIKNKTTSNIIISNISIPGASTEISITGTAANREAINTLKTSFESSTIFTEINIPLNNLEKKVNIPFSMTFKLKN